VRRDRRLPYQEIGGLAVVLVPARRELHQLDEVGTFLWSALAESRTSAELAAAVARQFEVEPADAERDVREFLAALEERGLLES
jgi:hypothetical protein